MSSTPPGPEPPRKPALRPGPEGGARDRNRRKRTAALQEAALQLFLERGLEAPSVGDIARAAGMGKASFYSYFETKEQLLETLLEPLGGLIIDALNQCRREVGRLNTHDELLSAHERLGVVLVAALAGNGRLVRLYLQEAQGPASGTRRPLSELSNAIVEAVVELTETAQARGLLADVHPRVSALLSLGAVERLAAGFLAGDELGEPVAAANVLVRMVQVGLRRDP